MKPTPVSDASTLGAVIRGARKERSWTQGELARIAGVGRRLIVDLEGGHERAEVGKVLSVLTVLGCAVTVASVEQGNQ